MTGRTRTTRRQWHKSVSRLILLVLLVLSHTPTQTKAPSLDDQAKHSATKREKRQPLDKAFVLVGAGDIASCKSLEGARATAKLIEQIPGTVFATGDLAYEKGSATEFKNCYDPAWGRFKDRTKPALGNHEYVDPTASGYFQYWGTQAG